MPSDTSKERAIETVNAETRQRLTEISGLISKNLLQVASAQLQKLITHLSPSELLLVAPDIQVQINRFFKQRKRDLLEVLETRIALLSTGGSSKDKELHASHASTSTPVRIKLLSARADELLRQLASNYIFKWAPHYRDRLRFIFSEALTELPNSGRLESELSQIGESFSAHALDIFSRGFDHQIKRGLSPEVAEIKSLSGLQSFLDLVISVYLEYRSQVSKADGAEVLWGLTSTAVAGILRGYGSVAFGIVHGWSLLKKNTRTWVPPIGFCRGSELEVFFEDFPESLRDKHLRVMVSASMLAVERMAHGFHGDDILLPRLSRLSFSRQMRLDITVSARRGGLNRDLLISCFCDASVLSEQPILAAQSLRAAAIVGRIDRRLDEWIEQIGIDSVVDASEVEDHQQQIHHLSELILGKIEAHKLSDAEFRDPSIISHNYARDFPLEDPEFRRQFMVERHSVKKLLQELDASVGVHLWCSVRRSGKTTAAHELADASGHSVVVAQTMDSVARQPIQNIFRQRVREAFKDGGEIDDDFFQQVVRECTLATTASDVPDRRIVFIIDEYETFFALIDARIRDDSGLKVKVALPLLSQMVDFATRNLLVFMGQRPDAYLVLSAQSQLSPVTQQYSFPLFEHFQGAQETEFTQFLKYVLTEKLPFDDSFAMAIFEETSGHPYLTVNLMVDFCDWLIVTKLRPNGDLLTAQQFKNFSKDRLSPAAMKLSPHYEFFYNQMAEYLSEQARTDEPWLATIAHTLRAIALKHPKTLACPLSGFEKLAAQAGGTNRIPATRLLTTGNQANFLRLKDGVVSPGVRLLARLAGVAEPKLN